jgi:hypothetical protein
MGYVCTCKYIYIQTRFQWSHNVTLIHVEIRTSEFRQNPETWNDVISHVLVGLFVEREREITEVELIKKLSNWFPPSFLSVSRTIKATNTDHLMSAKDTQLHLQINLHFNFSANSSGGSGRTVA